MSLADLEARAGKWLIYGLCALALGIAGAGAWSCHKGNIDRNATAQSSQHQVNAAVSAAQGATHDQQTATLKAEVAKLRGDVSRTKADLAKAKKALAAHQQQVPEPVHGVDSGPAGGDPVDLVADLKETVRLQADVIGKQDAVISAQGDESAKKDQIIASITAARDSYKLAFEESAKDAALQRIAHEAAQSEAKANRWWGRAEGAGATATVWAVVRLLGGI